MTTLVDQLVEFYHYYDKFQEPRISEEEVRKTITATWLKDRYVTCTDSQGWLLGYVESWRITFEQFGRLLCCLPLDVGVEDITTGPICYVANTTIRSGYRNWHVWKELRNQLFLQNFDAQFFVGEAKRKGTGIVKVFKRGEFAQRWRAAGTDDLMKSLTTHGT